MLLADKAKKDKVKFSQWQKQIDKTYWGRELSDKERAENRIRLIELGVIDPENDLLSRP